MAALNELLSVAGAQGSGHTAFRNGLHANGWVEKGEVIRHPSLLDRVAAWQARQLAEAFPEATLLVGAPACGAVLAAFVGRHLKLPVAFMEADSGGWHRMHVPASSQRAVYLDDLICTGTDARAVLGHLRRMGHATLGVSAWLSRTAMAGETLVTLDAPPFQTYEAQACPLCASGDVLTWTDIRE